MKKKKKLRSLWRDQVSKRLYDLEHRVYDDVKIMHAFEGVRGQIAACDKRIIELQDQCRVLLSMIHNDNNVYPLTSKVEERKKKMRAKKTAEWG